MNNEKWNNVLIQWVNCLKFCKKIINIDELRNGEFFANLQKVITKSRNTQQDTLTFIFDLFGKHYPKYSFENKTEIHLFDLPETDLLAITSLLMHYTCIYDRKDVLTSPLCHSLSQSNQLIIRNFLQKITKEVTNVSMNNIIKSCIDDASDNLSNNQWLSVDTSSARNSPLQDLLKTPIAKLGRLQEKDRIIAKLKGELENERYERAELQQELKQQLEKNKKIEQQLLQKGNEISRLRAEVAALENRTPPHYQDMDSRELQRRLRAEIQTLEQYIKQIENEQEEIRKEKDTAKEKLRKVEVQSNMWEEKFFETERNFESLKENSKKQEEEFNELQAHCAELTAMLEEYKTKPDESLLYDTYTSVAGRSLDETPPCEDLAHSVVEVQLREQQKKNEELKMQIMQSKQVETTLRDSIIEIEAELKKSEDFNEKLIVEIESLKGQKETLEEKLEKIEESLQEAKQKDEDKAAEIKSLICQLEKSCDSLLEVKKENEEFVSKLKIFEAKNEDIEKKLFEVSEDLKIERIRTQVLENERDQAKTISEKLQFELAEVVLSNQKVSEELQVLKHEKETLTINLDQTESNRRVLEIRLSEFENYCESLKCEIDGLQKQNTVLHEDLEKERSLIVIYEQEKSQLKLKIDILERTNEELKNELMNMQSQLCEALSCVESNQNHAKELEKEQTMLEKQLNEVQTAYEKLTDTFGELQNENLQINALLVQTKTHLDVIEEEKCATKKELHQVEELRQSLVEENEKFAKEVENLQRSFFTTTSCLEKSKNEVKELKEMENSLKLQLCVEKNSLVEEKKKVQEFETDNRSIRQQLNEKEALIQSLEESMKGLNQKNEELRVIISDLMEKNKDVKEQLMLNEKNHEELIARRNDVVRQWKQAEEELELVKSELSRIRLEREELNEELKKSKENFTKIQEEKTEVDSKLKESEEKKKKEIDSIQRQLSEAVDSLRISEAKMADLFSDMKINKEETEEIKSQFAEQKAKLTSQIQNLEEKVKVAEAKVADFEEEHEEYKKLKLRFEEIEAESKTTQKLVEELEDIRSSLEKEKNSLEVKLMNVEEELRDISKQNEETLLENKGLKKQIEEIEAEKEQIEIENKKVQDFSENIMKEKEKIENEKITLQRGLEKMEEVTRKCQNENVCLSQQRDNLQEEIYKIKEFKQKIEMQLQESLRSSQELEKQKNELEMRYTESLQKNEELKSSNDKIQNQLSVLERDYEQLKSNKDTIDRQLNEVSILFSTLKSESEDFSLQYQKAKIELAETKEVIEKITEEKDKMMQVIKETSVKNEELQRDLESTKKKLKDLEKVELEAQEVENRNTLLMSNNEELEKRNAEVEVKSKEEKESLETEINRLTSMMCDYKNELEAAMKQADKAEENKLKDLEKAEEAENRNTVLMSINEELERRIAEVEVKSKEEKESLEAEVNRLTSMMCGYKNELEAAMKQVEKAEEGLNERRKELSILNEKLERVAEEKSVLDNRIEVEKILSSENREQVKALEETVQDYEITISGLKTVVDANLERLEVLKEELSEKENREATTFKVLGELLRECNIECEENYDLKSFVVESFNKILKMKKDEEEKVRDLENEIKELSMKNTIDINSSFTEMIGKLQALVIGKSEIVSMDTLKTCFDNVHIKVKNLMEIKEKLSQELQKAESCKTELTKQLGTLTTEKEKVVKAKTELDDALKEERVKVTTLRKELELAKPQKPEKENILGVSSKVNKSREEELKKENMMLKRKIVLTENAKNNLEKVLKELREEKKKTVAPPSPTNDVLYKKLLHEYIQVKEDNERLIKEKDRRIEELSCQNEQLKNDLPVREDDKKVIQDLQNIREAYGNVMSANSKLELEVVTLRKIIEERNCEMASLTHIKEAYEKLLEENNKMMTEVDTVKYKRMRDKEEFVRLLKKEREEIANREMKRVQEVRAEYEGKLEKMKEKMLKLYREEVNKKVKSMKDGQNETANLIKNVATLKSELFEADQKIQLLQMEVEILKTNRKLDGDVRTVQLQSVSSITSITTERTNERNTFPRPSISKEISVSQRTSIGGMSNFNTHNLQMEDEEDMFNDKYLTDLKEGRCTLPLDRDARFSELAWRNSMVPPHLKSSYPAETQFVSPSRFKDDDIKTGNIEFEDSLCKLLPGEKPRKKDFGTTSYKKPGPPTPSKNGGRLSLQGNEVHPMREHCEAKTPKKSTPSRIRALFTGRTSGSIKEESNLTPSRGRRLNIFRRPR